MTVDEALNMKFVEMKVPTFLLAEDPFGYKRPELYVQYIYSPSYLSLILVISKDNTLILNDDITSRPHKEYIFTWDILPKVRMPFTLYIFQNNVEQTGGILAPAISEVEFLNKAWEFYELYIKQNAFEELERHMKK